MDLVRKYISYKDYRPSKGHRNCKDSRPCTE